MWPRRYDETASQFPWGMVQIRQLVEFKPSVKVSGAELGASGRTSRFHITQSALEAVLKKSIPTQIRQLILYISNSKGQVDRFVGELASAKRL